jgi:hypothetical protein
MIEPNTPRERRLIQYFFQYDSSMVKKEDGGEKLSLSSRLRFQQTKSGGVHSIISMATRFATGRFSRDDKLDSHIWEANSDYWIGPYLRDFLNDNDELRAKAILFTETVRGNIDTSQGYAKMAEEIPPEIYTDELKQACTLSYAHFCWRIIKELDDNGALKSALTQIGHVEGQNGYVERKELDNDSRNINFEALEAAACILTPFDALEAAPSYLFPKNIARELFERRQSIKIDPDTPLIEGRPQSIMQDGAFVLEKLFQMYGKSFLELAEHKKDIGALTAHKPEEQTGATILQFPGTKSDGASL